jgi:hypothetical protein
MIRNNKNIYNFASTVSVEHNIRTAYGSFLEDSNFTNNNTPPMPLNDAHLGGLFFL